MGGSAPWPPLFREPVKIDATVSALWSRTQSSARVRTTVPQPSPCVLPSCLRTPSHASDIPDSTATAYLLKMLLASFAHVLIWTETRPQHLH